MVDRAKVDILSEEMLTALQDVAKQHGVLVSKEGGKFGADRVIFQVAFTDATDGIPTDFAAKAQGINIPTDCYGKVFQDNGRAYQVTGINLRRRRYPVSAIRVDDGKTYKFTASTVRLLFGG